MNESIFQNLQKKYPVNALKKILKLPKNISLNQLERLIRREFAAAVGGDSETWISEIYKDHVIAYFSKEGKYYKIPFVVDDAGVRFELAKKVEVVRCWQEVK